MNSFYFSIFLFSFSVFGASRDYNIVCRNGVNNILEKSTDVEPKDFSGPCPFLGDRVSFFEGNMQTYLQINPDGTPFSFGITFPLKTLEDLPSKDMPNDFQNCFDADENGTIFEKECVGGHFRFLFFPKKTIQTPIKWASISYSPVGRLPPGIFDVPLFEFRFNLRNFSENNNIKLGPCPGLINCEDYALAAKDVPEKFLPKGYANLNIIEGKVGNFLVDTHGPEFDPKKKFRNSFIFGSFNGSISFFEVMVSQEVLKEKKSICYPIKQAEAYEELGYYPTKYCIKYWEEKNQFFISLENFARKRK
jgi:hypothetical protein